MKSTLSSATCLEASDLVDLATRINQAHHAAETALCDGLNHALEAGRLLIQAKAQCVHGDWGQWLVNNFEGSKRTAQAYVRVARRWPEIETKAQRVAHLGFRDAIKLLAEPKQKAEPAVGDLTSPERWKAIRAEFDRIWPGREKLSEMDDIEEVLTLLNAVTDLSNQAGMYHLNDIRAFGRFLAKAEKGMTPTDFNKMCRKAGVKAATRCKAKLAAEIPEDVFLDWVGDRTDAREEVTLYDFLRFTKYIWPGKRESDETEETDF